MMLAQVVSGTVPVLTDTGPQPADFRDQRRPVQRLKIGVQVIVHLRMLVIRAGHFRWHHGYQVARPLPWVVTDCGPCVTGRHHD
jgi:hypothetical protein